MLQRLFKTISWKSSQKSLGVDVTGQKLSLHCVGQCVATNFDSQLPAAPKNLRNKPPKQFIRSCNPSHDTKWISRIFVQVMYFLFAGLLLAKVNCIKYKSLGRISPDHVTLVFKIFQKQFFRPGTFRVRMVPSLPRMNCLPQCLPDCLSHKR